MKKVFSILIAIAILFSLAACGKVEPYSNKGKKEGGTTVWYLGGNNILVGDVNVESLFSDVKDTIDPASIYSALKLTEKMLHGVYTLNNKEKDIKSVRKTIPFEEVEFKTDTVSIASLPIAVYFGTENISSIQTRYQYSEFENITDNEVAVIEFATADEIGQTPCTYEINGNSIVFKQIEQTSADDAAEFTYDYTGVEFSFEFSLTGPYITFTKNGNSLQLKAFCFTENTDNTLSLSGYSLPDSPLVGELDYFASTSVWNYAVRRDGSYYDLSAYKMTDDGKFTVYLSDKNINGETEKVVNQYAYIVQSAADSFLTDFSVILLDGEKEYYYTDDITQREARVLKAEGTDINGLTEEEIKEIAEKKSDLFDDLYKEFEAQGIDVTINRSNGEIAMDASVLFGGDSAEITSEGKALLNKFLAAYTSIVYNEKYNGFIAKTMIEGHTAPVDGSTYESGLPLSQERANNVKDYCLSADTGVDSSKLISTLESVGLSNSKPIFNSEGVVDIDECRRVSFRFIVDTTNK